MDRETDDAIHHRLRNDVGRSAIGERSQDVAHRADASLLEQERAHGELAPLNEDAEHDLPFGDEEAVATDEIALAHGGVRLERGMRDRRDVDEMGSHGSATLSPIDERTTNPAALQKPAYAHQIP
jgi:hypothetical protein